MLESAGLSALLNVFVFAGIPFLFYFLYHKLRHKPGFRETAPRAGLRPGEASYIGYCFLFAANVVTLLVAWPPSLESSVLEGLAFRPFMGLGLSTLSVSMALLYGVIKPGFAEEFLCRGLIAGSVSRTLLFVWANLIQAAIFLVPHLLLIFVMPELWVILPFIFIGSLFAGWVRIKSDSIVGPWMIHASVNNTMAVSVAVQSAV